MHGPRFLSMVAQGSYFCGGAHPAGEAIALVFDMQSGSLVNWVELNPSVSAGSSAPDPADGADSVTITLPALRHLYMSAAPPECRDAYDDLQRFLLWPDAKSSTLIAQAAGLAQVDQPCVNELKLTMEQARKLGFSQELLRAIEEAHRRAPGTAA